MSKRLFDVAVVIFLAPFWLPVLCFVALTTRVALGKPVLFRQNRPGK